MAEPVTGFLGFSFGATAFLMLIRNAIERISTDVDTNLHHNQHLIQFKGRISRFHEEAEHWENFWNITPSTPQAVLEAYWGKNGANDLRLQYVLVKELSKQLLDQFFHLCTGYLSWVVEKGELVVYRERGSLKTLLDATFRKPLFKDHLESLQKSLEDLIRWSFKRYMNHNRLLNEDEVKAEKIGESRRKVHMDRAVPLLVGQVTTATSRRFLLHLNALSLKHVDLQIDQAFSADTWRRLDVLEDYSNKQRLLYRLHAFQDRLKSTTDLVIESCSSDPGRDPHICLHAGLEAALTTLIGYGNRNPGLTWYSDPETGVPFRIESATRNYNHSSSLQEYIADMQIPFTPGLHGKFSLTERARVAYELAECALIYSRTDLFRNICSCSIRRTERKPATGASPPECLYTLQLGEVRHIRSTAMVGQAEVSVPICQRHIKTRHIQRLGLVLWEIATGAEPWLQLAAEVPSRRMSFGVDELSEIGHDIADIMGVDFSDAVEYCLAQEKAVSGEMDEPAIHAFYWRVVKPWVLLFHSQTRN
jgi:hypothetical protein